ncbi:MAG: WG repeat-containing protein [Mucinivorans sp.]
MKKILLPTLLFFVLSTLGSASAQDLGGLIKGFGGGKNGAKAQQEELAKAPATEARVAAVAQQALPVINVPLVIHITPNTKRVEMEPECNPTLYFSDSMLTMERNTDGTFGFLDIEGNLKIGFLYKCAAGYGAPQFNSGVCPVVIEKEGKRKFFIIDKQGKQTALPETMIEVSNFCQGRATAQYMVGDKVVSGFIDSTGKIIYPDLVRRSKFALADPDVPSPFVDGLARFFDVSNDKWGYHNRKGEVVIESKFFEAGDFSQSLAAVLVDVDGAKKWGFIDPKGQFVIPAKFSNRPSDFASGYAVVIKSNDNYCYIDQTGAVKSGEYYRATPFHGNQAFVRPLDDKEVVQALNKEFVVVHTTDKFSFPTSLKGKYNDVVFCDYSLAAVGNGTPYNSEHKYLVDTIGRTIINNAGINSKLCNFFSGLAYGVVSVGVGETATGFFNRQGEAVFIFCKPEF